MDFKIICRNSKHRYKSSLTSGPNSIFRVLMLILLTKLYNVTKCFKSNLKCFNRCKTRIPAYLSGDESISFCGRKSERALKRPQSQQLLGQRSPVMGRSTRRWASDYLYCNISNLDSLDCVGTWVALSSCRVFPSPCSALIRPPWSELWVGSSCM